MKTTIIAYSEESISLYDTGEGSRIVVTGQYGTCTVHGPIKMEVEGSRIVVTGQHGTCTVHVPIKMEVELLLYFSVGTLHE